MDEDDHISRTPLRPSSAGRRLALAAAVLVLLALVAAASRAHHTPGGRPGGHRPPRAVGDYLFSTFVVAMVAALVAIVYVVVRERGTLMQPPSARRGPLKALAFLVVLALVGAIFMRAHGRLGSRPPAAVAPPRTPPAARSGRARAEAAPRFEWLPVLLAGGAAVAVLGAVATRSLRRGRSPLVEEFVLEREFADLVDETLADLYAETDPRRAIIACYARLEGLFAGFGLPRDRAEAPVEYLERVLPALRTSGPALRRLTALFEWAKFSEHDVDSSMRDRAIDALVAVRDELRAKRLEVAAA
jgi:hypothetical protein